MREAIDTAGIDADIDVVLDGEAAGRYFEAAGTSENTPCPDLVLLDMNLPKRSGDKVLENLRARAQCANAKILIVSSSDLPKDLAVAEAFSVAGYFKKPSSHTDFMKLGSLVKQLLDKRA